MQGERKCIREPSVLHRAILIGLKWLLTFATFACLALFVGTGWTADWNSPSLRYRCSVFRGAIELGARPEELIAADSPYSPQPGWSVSLFPDNWPPTWLPRVSWGRIGNVVVIPLWIPAVALAGFASFLWWRQRTDTRRVLSAWLRPPRRVRVRIWTVLVATVISVVTGLGLEKVLLWRPAGIRLAGYMTDWLHTWVVGALLLAAPIVGILLVILWTRLRNTFLDDLTGSCQECGYDLTGNTSGRCPECGASIASEDCSAGESGSQESV